MLALAATSCAGPDDSPSARPGSATSSPRAVTPSQRTKLELRQVIKIIASSPPGWKKTPVTCELQDGALRECLVSTLDQNRVVLVVGPPFSGAKYVLGLLIVDAADVARAQAAFGSQFGVGWSVDVHLTPEGAKACTELRSRLLARLPRRTRSPS
jgi:hypothetical protein